MTAALSDAVPSPRHTATNYRPAADWGRWLVIALLALLWLAALVFAGRRLAGALSTPLDIATLAAVAVAAAAVAALVRLCLAARAPWSIHANITVALALLALAMSLPGTSPLGLVLLWSVLSGEEAWAWWLYRVRRPLRSASADEQPPPKSDDVAICAAEGIAEEDSCGIETDGLTDEDVGEESLPAADVLQRLTRSRAADGSETFTGWLRVPLAAGQRTANLHLAFCPAFGQTPTITVDQQDGPAARIRPVQLLPYGARFDLKLAQTCEEDSAIVLHFVAEAPPPKPTAG